MQAKLPPDTRRDFDWIIGLSGEGMMVAAGGVLLLLMLWNQPWPVTVRVTLGFLILIVTAVLSWGRYPMANGGDRMTVWAGRLWRYVTQHRRVLFHEGSGRRHGSP